MKKTIKITISILVCLLFAYSQVYSQGCLCPVKTIRINTGYAYNPITNVGGAITTPTAADPRWQVTARDGGCIPWAWAPVPPFNSRVVPTIGGAWAGSAVSRWISINNASAYPTPTAGWGVYRTRFTRTFELCTADNVTITIPALAFDNGVNIFLDGGTTIGAGTPLYSQITGTPALSYSVFQTNFVTFTTFLSAGIHTIDCDLDNEGWGSTDPNGYGLNIIGTVTSAGTSLLPDPGQRIVYGSSGAVSGDNPICPFTDHTYASTVSGGTWTCSTSPSASGASIGLTSGILHAASAGTITITYTAPGCVLPSTYFVTVNPLPALPTLVYTGCVVPCPGTPLTYDVSGTPGSYVTWEWVDPTLTVHSEPGFYIPTSGPPVHTVTIPTGAYPPGTYGITILNVTHPNGCSIYGFSQTIDVEWPHGDFFQSPKAICVGDPVTLWVTGSMGGCPAGGIPALPAGDVYVTDLSSGLTTLVPLTPFPGSSTSGVGSVTFYPTATTTYQITGATNYVCSHTFSGTTLTVVVLPLPAISVASATPIPCEGTPLVLTATCPTCTEPYYWSGPASGLPASFPLIPPTFTVPFAAVSDAGTYVVTGGAMDPDYGVVCYNHASTFAPVNPAPTATMWCESACDGRGGFEAILHFHGSPGHVVRYTDGVLPIAWVPLDGTSGDGTRIVPITTTTTFYITDVFDPVTGCHSIFSPIGCTVTPTMPPAPTIIGNDMFLSSGLCVPYYTSSVYPVTLDLDMYIEGVPILPPATVWDASVLPGQKTLTSATPDPVQGCDVTSWFAPAVWTGTSAYNPCTPLDLTHYLDVWYVVATSVTYMGCKYDIHEPIDHNCHDDVWPRYGHGSGKSLAIDLSDLNSFTVIPNPNTGDFTLKGHLKTASNGNTASIEVLDLLGKVVLRDECKIEKGSINKQITLGNNMPNGVYIIKVKNDNESYTIRFTLSK